MTGGLVSVGAGPDTLMTLRTVPTSLLASSTMVVDPGWRRSPPRQGHALSADAGVLSAYHVPTEKFTVPASRDRKRLNYRQGDGIFPRCRRASLLGDVEGDLAGEIPVVGQQDIRLAGVGRPYRQNAAQSDPLAVDQDKVSADGLPAQRAALASRGRLDGKALDDRTAESGLDYRSASPSRWVAFPEIVKVDRTVPNALVAVSL